MSRPLTEKVITLFPIAFKECPRIPLMRDVFELTGPLRFKDTFFHNRR